MLRVLFSAVLALAFGSSVYAADLDVKVVDKAC
jgi:hypothetical protein